VGRKKGALLALAPQHLDLRAVREAQARADPQLLVGAEKVVAAPQRKAVEEGLERPERRALPCLVRTEDELQPFVSPRKIEPAIGERTEGFEMQVEKPQGLRGLGAFWRGGSREEAGDE